MYRFDQRFPFFNMYDEKTLYHTLIKNKELKFYYKQDEYWEHVGTDCTDVWISCTQYHLNSVRRSDLLNITCINGGGSYYLKLNRIEVEDVKKVMNKLYKRHRNRFISYYNRYLCLI